MHQRQAGITDEKHAVQELHVRVSTAGHGGTRQNVCARLPDCLPVSQGPFAGGEIANALWGIFDPTEV